MFDDLIPQSKAVATRTGADLALPPGGYRYGPGSPNYIPPQAVTGTGHPPATIGTSTGGSAPATGGSAPATGSALGAWDTFYQSPTFQVPLQQGLKAVNTNYAAKGALESGAAMKAISDYGAGSASGALNTYLDDLYRQESLGMSASSALAGVGQNMVTQVSANNTNASNAAGNAALVAGQGAANNWNNVGSAIGTTAGTIAGALGSSYHPASTAPLNTGYVGIDGFH